MNLPEDCPYRFSKVEKIPDDVKMILENNSVGSPAGKEREEEAAQGAAGQEGEGGQKVTGLSSNRCVFNADHPLQRRPRPRPPQPPRRSAAGVGRRAHRQGHQEEQGGLRRDRAPPRPLRRQRQAPRERGRGPGGLTRRRCSCTSRSATPR